MKKIIALLLLLSTAVLLIACSPKYEPVKSTDKELTACITLEYGGKKYDVNYELWRALYLTYRDQAATDVELEALILDRACDVYATLALCEELGINLYSANINKKIEAAIAESIEGSDTVLGYGSYDNFLAALKKMNLNYSAHTLLLRYAYGLEALDEYYIGTFTADDIENEIVKGKIEYTRDDVYEFYYSDECVRVLRAHIQANAYYNPDEYAATVRERMAVAAAQGVDKVANVIINTGLTAPTEVQRGYVIARYNLDRFYYAELTDAAFNLNTGGVSEPVTVHNGDEKIIFILYKAEKNDAHFDESYTELAYVYLANKIGEMLADVRAELATGVQYTDFYRGLNFTEVSMDE